MGLQTSGGDLETSPGYMPSPASWPHPGILVPHLLTSCLLSDLQDGPYQPVSHPWSLNSLPKKQQKDEVNNSCKVAKECVYVQRVNLPWREKLVQASVKKHT